MHVQLWESSTGRVITEFRGHEDIVKYCCLSHSEKLIVSSSCDKTVKVTFNFVVIVATFDKSQLVIGLGC